MNAFKEVASALAAAESAMSTSALFLCSAASLLALCQAYALPATQVSVLRRSRQPVALAAEEVDVTRIHSEADKFFSAIDDNGDGFISFVELNEHLAKLGYEQGGIDHVFDLLDVNRDGEISQSELRESFVKYDDPALRAALGLGETEADSIFNSIDANGDGEICKEELQKFLTSKGYNADTADSVFSALDDNGDGAISRDELHEGYTSYSALRSILGLSA